MGVDINSTLREQLLDRRHRLEAEINIHSDSAELQHLMEEVDEALERMHEGTYGLCETCKEPIEMDRLIADPLARLCLEHLTPSQQRALEEDLKLASRIQNGLLPEPGLTFAGWRTSYHYEPAGIVSGDYCDLIASESGDLYFILGDVSGKGVAASMLMVHLHAMFRSLISFGMPLQQLIERASRVFCESTLPAHYATLVCGKAHESGTIEICNAGHLPPLLAAKGNISPVEPTSMPVGVFCDQHFTARTLDMTFGDTLFLCTDGVTETQNRSGNEYGSERLFNFIRSHHELSPDELVQTCLDDLSSFRHGTPKKDDLTIMVLRRIK